MAYRSRSAEPGTDAQIQIRLPLELRERLTAEAGRRDVSTNLLAVKAIEQALAIWEKQKLT